MEFSNYNRLYDEYVDQFVREYGERKALKVGNTIKMSKHTKSLMSQSINLGVVPSSKDFRATVLSNMSLAFSSTQTIRFASVILFNIWQNEINLNVNMLSGDRTVELFEKIKRDVA